MSAAAIHFDHACIECGCDCAEYESKSDFAQWQESEHCSDCSDRLFKEEQSELRGLRSAGY